MKKIYLGFLFFIFCFTCYCQTTYTWNVASGSWATPSSWTPSRGAPATNDILIFNGSTFASPTVTLNVVTETIGQLKFINGVAATISAASGINQSINKYR